MNSEAKAFAGKGSPIRFWLLFTAALVALCCLFPLSGDDWQWALERGFPNFNGRYLGNITAMLITSNTWLKPIVTGLVLSGILFFVAELTGNRRAVYFAAPLMLFLPTATFAQVYVWGSGFANYTMPVFFILLCFLMIKKAEQLPKALCIFAAFLSAAAAQLFSENVTVGMLLFFAVLLVYCIKKKLPCRAAALAALLGAALGAVLMLTNPAYHGGVVGAHTMPTISEMLSNLVTNYFSIIAPYLVTRNAALVIVLCVLMLRLIHKSKPEMTLLDRLLSFFFCLMAVYEVLCTIYPAITSYKPLRAAEGLIAAAFLVLFIFSLLRYLKPGAVRAQVIFLVLAAVFVNAPLFVLNPIGPRCFFISYIFMILIGAHVFLQLREESAAGAETKAPLRSMYAAVLLGIFLVHFVIYGHTALTVNKREAYIAQQLSEGRETIEVISLPYPEYVWNSAPIDDYVQLIFKCYYGIPQEYKLLMA